MIQWQCVKKMQNLNKQKNQRFFFAFFVFFKHIYKFHSSFYKDDHFERFKLVSRFITRCQKIRIFEFMFNKQKRKAEQFFINPSCNFYFILCFCITLILAYNNFTFRYTYKKIRGIFSKINILLHLQLC